MGFIIENISLVVLIIILSASFFILGVAYQRNQTEETIDYAYLRYLAEWQRNNSLKYSEGIKDYIYQWRSVCNPQVECNCEEPSFFMNLVKANANAREYKLDVYDCTEFAENGARALRVYGWKAKDIYVQVNCSAEIFDNISCETYEGGHRIIMLEKAFIEPTTGEVITPSLYGKDYYNICREYPSLC